MTPQRLVDLALVASMDADLDSRHEGADAYRARLAWLRPGEDDPYTCGYEAAAHTRLDPLAPFSQLIETAQDVLTDLYTPAGMG